jgi:hypothetical protein
MARIRELRAQAPDAARREAPLACATMVFARIEDDGKRALAAGERRLGALYGSGMESAAGRFGVLGTAAECRARAAGLAEAGVEHLLLSPIVDGDLDAQLERLSGLREGVK